MATSEFKNLRRQINLQRLAQTVFFRRGQIFIGCENFFFETSGDLNCFDNFKAIDAFEVFSQPRKISGSGHSFAPNQNRCGKPSAIRTGSKRKIFQSVPQCQFQRRPRV